jgi:hypothetical protein
MNAQWIFHVFAAIDGDFSVAISQDHMQGKHFLVVNFVLLLEVGLVFCPKMFRKNCLKILRNNYVLINTVISYYILLGMTNA